MSIKKGVSFFMALFLFAAGGCSDDQEKVSAPEQETKPSTDIWEPQKQQIEKAKEVEQQILDADERRRKEMEEKGI
jgi:hypothetical protein